MKLDYLEMLDMTATMLGFFFPLWPLIILSALRGRRNFLVNMLIGWIAMAIFGVVSLFASVRPTGIWGFIPEPWNLTAFIATGAILVTALFARKYGRKVWTRRKAERAGTADELLNLSPREFEEVVAELYAAMGHKARRTGAVGDHGVDVVVQTAAGEKWIVQCKRWRGIVGEAVIRDFYGVLHHEKADRGAIVTTGTFSTQARLWARGKPIELVDSEELLRLLKRARAVKADGGASRVI